MRRPFFAPYGRAMRILTPGGPLGPRPRPAGRRRPARPAADGGVADPAGAGDPLPGYRDVGAASVAFALLVNVPLLWRRLAPRAVLAVIFTATVVADVAAVAYGTGLGMVVALYTVASACERRRSVPAFLW